CLIPSSTGMSLCPYTTLFRSPGILQLVIGTKSSTTVEAIQGLHTEIDKLKTNPINDSEIKRAKDTILNNFVFNFDTPDKVLRERSEERRVGKECRWRRVTDRE